MSDDTQRDPEPAEPEPPLPGQPFDPRRYLTTISGTRYLEVKWRLLWLRTVQPDAAIETEMVRDDGANAIFRARVTLPSGASATGWGSESYQDFGDYVEKAETKSLGRALAALGYGTQFCEDHDFGAAERGRVVDSPVNVSRIRVADPATERGQSGATRAQQMNDFWSAARAAGYEVAAVIATSTHEYGLAPDKLADAARDELLTALREKRAVNDPDAGWLLLPHQSERTDAGMEDEVAAIDATPQRS